MNEKRSGLEHLLSDLSRDQLQSVLLKLTEHDPSLIAVIERQVARVRPSTSPHHPPIDPKAIRRQAHCVLFTAFDP